MTKNKKQLIIIGALCIIVAITAFIVMNRMKSKPVNQTVYVPVPNISYPPIEDLSSFFDGDKLKWEGNSFIAVKDGVNEPYWKLV